MDLRGECTERGIKWTTKTLKYMLINELCQYDRDMIIDDLKSACDEDNDNSESNKKRHKKKRKTKRCNKSKNRSKNSNNNSNSNSNNISSDELTDDDIITADSTGDYESMSRDKLRIYCQAKRLQVGGLKSTLIRRLEKYDNDPTSIRKIKPEMKYVETEPDSRLEANDSKVFIPYVCFH